MKEYDITSGNTQFQLNEKLHHFSIPISYLEGEMVQGHIITLPSILWLLHFQNSSADEI